MARNSRSTSRTKAESAKAKVGIAPSQDAAQLLEAKENEFQRLISKTKPINDKDKNLLVQILCARMIPSKIQPKSQSRADVTVKKILRMARNFYDQKLEHEVMYKNKRNNVVNNSGKELPTASIVAPRTPERIL